MWECWLLSLVAEHFKPDLVCIHPGVLLKCLEDLNIRSFKKYGLNVNEKVQDVLSVRTSYTFTPFIKQEKKKKRNFKQLEVSKFVGNYQSPMTIRWKVFQGKRQQHDSSVIFPIEI